jgi:hypothetical protein
MDLSSAPLTGLRRTAGCRQNESASSTSASVCLAPDVPGIRSRLVHSCQKYFCILDSSGQHLVCVCGGGGG